MEKRRIEIKIEKTSVRKDRKRKKKGRNNDKERRAKKKQLKQ